MRYTVVMYPSAEDQLTNIWIGASDRNTITRASSKIDSLLKDDPEKSVAKWVDLYALRVDPLAVLCEIDTDDRMVRIVEVIRTDS